MSSILITGNHGFIGNNLVDALSENYSIYGLDIIFPEKKGVIKTYAWNDLQSMPKVDVLIHLAGKAHDTKNVTNYAEYYEINVRLTQKIFDYFIQSDIKTFIFFSSVKASADSVQGDMLYEETEPHPLTPYGQSKLEAEHYILSQSLHSSKKVFVLRPCMIHGFGNKGNLNLLYKVVSLGLPWPLGALENHRSFLSIDNLTFVINQMIEKDISSGIYQVADDDSISTNEVIKLIAQSVNKKPRILNLSKRLIYFLAKLGDVMHLPLNSERLKKLSESYVVSNSKLKTALGIQKMPFDLRDGLKKSFSSFSLRKI